MYACGIYGYQDTLYAKSGYQYFSRCYIEGILYPILPGTNLTNG